VTYKQPAWALEIRPVDSRSRRARQGPGLAAARSGGDEKAAEAWQRDCAGSVNGGDEVSGKKPGRGGGVSPGYLPLAPGLRRRALWVGPSGPPGAAEAGEISKTTMSYRSHRSGQADMGARRFVSKHTGKTRPLKKFRLRNFCMQLIHHTIVGGYMKWKGKKKGLKTTMSFRIEDLGRYTGGWHTESSGRMP
jgi:hypothetical protein